MLRLKHSRGEGKYYIDDQNDLYQVDQFVRFVWLGGWILVRIWQFIATLLCVLGAVVLWPVSIVEEYAGVEPEFGRKRRKSFDEIEMRDLERKSSLVDG